MSLHDRVKEILTNPNKKGIVFTGDNSSGKTYFIEKLAKDATIRHEYKMIYIPENCQDLAVENYQDMSIGGRQFSSGTENELRNLETVIDDRLGTKQRNDLDISIIPKILAREIPPVLNNFFLTSLKIKLNMRDPIEINIDSKEFSKLTSSGYKAMIRIASEIYLYLDENRDKKEKVIIFIDEIDSKFYWTNREKYFSALEKFINDTFPNKDITFIISTHMPETISKLPPKYSIIKILDTTNFKEYSSEDFLNIEQVERIIFDKKMTFIKESENLKLLKEIYFKAVESNLKFENYKVIIPFYGSLEYNFNTLSFARFLTDNSQIPLVFNYANLSTKEKIIFNSIKSLCGWR